MHVDLGCGRVGRQFAEANERWLLVEGVEDAAQAHCVDASAIA